MADYTRFTHDDVRYLAKANADRADALAAEAGRIHDDYSNVLALSHIARELQYEFEAELRRREEERAEVRE